MFAISIMLLVIAMVMRPNENRFSVSCLVVFGLLWAAALDGFLLLFLLAGVF